VTRIRLEGDHSLYHCGSAAAFESLRTTLAQAGRLVNADEDYDELFVNGEGSMHHGGPGFVKKMQLLQEAVASGRRAHLVNSVWQQNDGTFDAVLKRLTSISVREPLSQRDLADRHGTDAPWHLDASFYAAIDESASAPAEDWHGRVIITDFYAADLDVWFKVTRGPAERCHYIDMRDMSWSSLVKSLATARLLLTGRHHAVYAACKARVPFIAMRGNTHKIDGLIAASGLPIPIVDRLWDLEAHIVSAKASRAMYDELFDWMSRQPAWTP